MATHFVVAVTNKLPDTAIIYIREAINVLSVIAGTELNRDNIRGRTLMQCTEVVLFELVIFWLFQDPFILENVTSQVLGPRFYSALVEGPSFADLMRCGFVRRWNYISPETVSAMSIGLPYTCTVREITPDVPGKGDALHIKWVRYRIHAHSWHGNLHR